MQYCEDDTEWDPHEDDFIDVFQELFEFSLMECARVYWINRETKGDSWQDITPDELRFRVHNEIEEFKETKPGSGQEYNELIDLVNIALMLIDRLAK